MRSLLAPLVIIASVMALLAVSFGTGAQTPAKRIRVIYTNDTLGYVAPCG